MKIETSRQPSECVVSVCLRKSRVKVGSRSEIGIGHVGDDAWQVPLERIWLSVCDSAVRVFWSKASKVQVKHQVAERQHGGVAQGDEFPPVHP